ncbi:beta-glucosidase 22-like isoform X2 [Phalaenopsis equestris]|uniref:beta-glucosidase 22-like isoform X2 n=1 Tax=Phalaenopsis equestris TaxID=78828 RepID=UPI0009E33706|nr:beta-glucosidase 22-like isoform X2 [Phalaenopsis equestris]
MSDTGLEAYRLSISWPRLLPNGRGTVNPKGLEYYNNVIDELIKYGIQPHVTLHHLDVPQVLQDEYGGWLSPKIIDDFKELADVCFKEFGDRVSYWTTLNEPNINALASFDYGFFPPQRCSYPFGVNCTGGDSTVEPYITVHNYILAHSAAVELYRTKYQSIQKGQIGINIYSVGFTPLTNSTEDVMATKRAVDFILGWIFNPIMFGDYPESMKKNAGSRLPSFSYSESQKVKGSFDFIGINYYFAVFVADNPGITKTDLRDASSDMFAMFTAFKDVPPESRLLPPRELIDDFESLWKLLTYIKSTYKNPPIYIHENGYGLGVVDTMNDVRRASFLGGFIGSILDSIRDGVDARGYFVWTFVDAFELLAGYKSRFGLYHVNFEGSELERTPKHSAYCYQNFLKNGAAIIENSEMLWAYTATYHVQT